MPSNTRPGPGKLDKIIADANRERAKREQSYRERALKIYPWVCGRCAREFTAKTVNQLTVHHRDHNHDNNPPDGANWELLCVYCHENEHARYLDHDAAQASGLSDGMQESTATHQPFAGLKSLLEKKNRPE